MDVLSFLVLFVASATNLTLTQVYPSDKPYTLTVVIWVSILSVWLLAGILEGHVGISIEVILG